jgi:uncharacterized protein
MKFFIYLHGLNSSSRSVKAGILRERLAPATVLTPDYPAHRPAAAMELLTDLFTGLGPVCPTVIGSSMGGFYGQWLARRFEFAHLYLINPALTPWDLLPPYLGQTMTTALGETYEVTPELIAAFGASRIADPCDGVPTTVLLDRGDEVIDYRIAESIYRPCGRLLIWDGGDHAFQHMEEAISIIGESMNYEL